LSINSGSRAPASHHVHAQAVDVHVSVLDAEQ